LRSSINNTICKRRIDYKTLEKLVDLHVENSGSIICSGTTSEAATMTDEEYHSVIKFVIQRVNKKSQ